LGVNAGFQKQNSRGSSFGVKRKKSKKINREESPSSNPTDCSGVPAAALSNTHSLTSTTTPLAKAERMPEFYLSSSDLSSDSLESLSDEEERHLAAPTTHPITSNECHYNPKKLNDAHAIVIV
jgi:hypothetical protein